MTIAQDLLHGVRTLLDDAPATAALLELDVRDMTGDADLLAAILASIAPAGQARATLAGLAASAFRAQPSLVATARADAHAAADRNMEPGGVAACLLFYRGFHALLSHRLCHHLWTHGARTEALAVKTILDRALSTDIHPAARIGAGVWFDHGVGVVIGETAVIEDDVSIWHGVTLGSTLKESGPTRHPRIRRAATIGAGAILLGAIEIGERAVVAAGAVVLENVPAGTTVAGIPARARPRRSESFRGFAPASNNPTSDNPASDNLTSQTTGDQP